MADANLPRFCFIAIVKKAQAFAQSYVGED
jgi:hypothetical protein